MNEHTLAYLYHEASKKPHEGGTLSLIHKQYPRLPLIDRHTLKSRAGKKLLTAIEHIPPHPMEMAIEIYVVIPQNLSDLVAGIYHYDRVEKSFRLVADVPEKLNITSAVIIFTGALEEVVTTFGEMGYRELTAAVGQYIALFAQSGGVQYAINSTLDERALEEALDIDGFSEIVVSWILLDNSPSQ